MASRTVWQFMLLMVTWLPNLALCDSYTHTSAYSLYNKLFSDYNKHLKPGNGSLQVEISLELEKLVDIDQVAQNMEVTAWMSISWFDEKLSWDEEAEGIDSFNLPHSLIWKPDITILNQRDQERNIATDHQLVALYSDGTIYWYPGDTYVTSCQMDMSKFPFDSQSCYVNIGPWTSSADKVNVTTRNSIAGQDSYVENGQWELVTALMYRSELTEAGETMAKCQVKLSVNRRPAYHVMFTIAPAIGLALLSLVAFGVPHRSGEKMSFAITMFLSNAVFLTFYSQWMPTSSYSISRFAIYLCLQYVQNAFIVGAVAVVQIIADRHKSQTPPQAHTAAMKIFGYGIRVFNDENCCSTEKTDMFKQDSNRPAVDMNPNGLVCETTADSADVCETTADSADDMFSWGAFSNMVNRLFVLFFFALFLLETVLLFCYLLS